MASPIITDEQLEQENNTNVTPKKSLEQLMKEDSNMEVVEKTSDNFIDKELVKETEEELKEDIPSSFIEINLVSNGRIEGIPKKLHFRCYSASDAIDLNVSDDDKVKAVSKVLTRLNYENFDVSLLPIQDVLFILYKLHGAFISSKITKKVYIDDTIKDDEKLNNEDNLEEVDIPIASMVYAYLGKDYDDNELERKIKVPFTVKDKATNDKVQFRYTILKDMLMAETYCHNYFKNEFVKFADVRSAINKIKSIHDEEKQDATLDKYLNEHEDEVGAYYDFMQEYVKMVAKVVQCEAIVSYNDKILESLDEKWDVYANKLSISMWESYNKILEEFPFGISEEIDVFIPSLKKKVHRRVGFQFDDFLHVNNSENSDRCVVEFN